MDHHHQRLVPRQLQGANKGARLRGVTQTVPQPQKMTALRQAAVVSIGEHESPRSLDAHKAQWLQRP